MSSGLQHGAAADRTASQRGQGLVDFGQRAGRHRQRGQAAPPVACMKALVASASGVQAVSGAGLAGQVPLAAIDLGNYWLYAQCRRRHAHARQANAAGADDQQRVPRAERRALRG